MIESLSLINTVTKEQININKQQGEYWLDQVDFGQAEGTAHTFKFIDQIGETVYNTTLGTRQLQISGWVAAWDKMAVHRMKAKLNNFVNPQQLIEAYANGMKIAFYPRTSIVYSTTYAQNNELISKFLITGYCPYPLFTDADEHNVLVSYTNKRFKFPLIIPKSTGILMGIRQPTLIATVENDGDVEIGYIIEFRAYGTVKNPILIDIGSQKFIKIAKTMGNGEIITIDTRQGNRHIVGQSSSTEEATNYFKYRTLDSGWLSLQRGTNSIRYNAEEGVSALEVTIRFEPAYLEVDT